MSQAPPHLTYSQNVFSKVPGPWQRRPISNLILAVSAALTPIVAPIASVIAYIQDRRSGTGRLRRTRLVALIAAMLMIDLAGRIIVFGIWLQGPFGMNNSSPRIQQKYQTVMAWYTTKITDVISVIAPLPLDGSELDEDLITGNAILIGRHRSVFDALLPSVLLSRKGILARYTLKEELQWAPNLDIVGHRMKHVFVKRVSQDIEAGLRPIRELAARIDEKSTAVIFPEGTFFNQKRLERALNSIERRNPDRLELARKLRHLLPPRPAGTLAMLEAAPNADVIMVGHVGVEPFDGIPKIIANIGDTRRRLRIKAWRYERSTIPKEPEEQIHWLFERWVEMDEWIDSHHPLPN